MYCFSNTLSMLVHYDMIYPDSKWKLGQRWALSCNFRWANEVARCKTIGTLLIQKTLAQHVVQTLAQHVVQTLAQHVVETLAQHVV